MEEEYRLVFRGEVVEGQHPAVVQKRLGALLQLDPEKTEQLFSGAAVVLRRSVDRATAAQFQGAFKKAGAKLRVQPIRYEASDESAAAAAPPSATSEPSAEAARADTSGAEHGLRLLPVGSLILEVHERLPPVDAQVPTSHLQLDELSALEASDSSAEESVAVNVDHLSVAAVGSPLGTDTGEAENPPAEFAFSFELAEDGSWLQADAEEAQATIQAPDYELAEAGAVLGPTRPAADDQPPAPDVSHLSLEDDEPER
ncbi:MAG: hypothetical protein AB8B93_06500 [Pseudomonadales bacterium]